MIRLKYDRGTILLEGEVGTPYARWDPRVDAFRAMALYYPDILEYLDRSRLPIQDEVVDSLPIPPLASDLKLRPYQQAAFKAWLDAGRRGVIELPTGAGKTYIALKAVEWLNVSTLVVVPTLYSLGYTTGIVSERGMKRVKKAYWAPFYRLTGTKPEEE